MEQVNTMILEKIIVEFNDTGVEYDKHILLHELFEIQVKKTPERIALICGEEKITYSELNERANQLANKLCNLGVGKDNLVGLYVDRSIEMVIGIFAILKSGGAYLPISLNLGIARINFMIENCNAEILLTTSKYIDKFNNIKVLNLDSEHNYTGSKNNLKRRTTSESLAYVIYTSGSTGNPKGVMIEHYSVVNKIIWMQKEYDISENDVIMQKTPYSFDVSIWELFIWFLKGSTLCLLKQDGEKNVESVVKTIKDEKITLIHFVPSMLNIFLDFIIHRNLLDDVKSLKKVFSSGETLNRNTVDKYNLSLYKINETELHNLYGPTETTVHVSNLNCTNLNKDIVTIGRPFDNCRMYIFDKDGRLCDVGEEGEIYIAGDCVARGYINSEELTRENFRNDPYYVSQRMYKSGDFGKWNDRGEIEFIGRFDSQVKIRGNRIELSEIEVQLCNIDEVDGAVVVLKNDKNDNKYIDAYYVTDKEMDIEDRIRKHLENVLPDYMIPSHLIKIKSIPLTDNGKVDKKSLMEIKYENENADILKKSNEEIKIIEKIIEFGEMNISAKDVSVNEKMTDLNINSISYIKMIVAIETEFDIEFDDEFLDLNKFPTVKSLIDYVNEKSIVNV